MVASALPVPLHLIHAVKIYDNMRAQLQIIALGTTLPSVVRFLTICGRESEQKKCRAYTRHSRAWAMPVVDRYVG